MVENYGSHVLPCVRYHLSCHLPANQLQVASQKLLLGYDISPIIFVSTWGGCRHFTGTNYNKTKTCLSFINLMCCNSLTNIYPSTRGIVISFYQLAILYSKLV